MAEYTATRTCLFCRTTHPYPVDEADWTTVPIGEAAPCPGCGGDPDEEIDCDYGCVDGMVEPPEYFRCPSCTREGRTTLAGAG